MPVGPPVVLIGSSTLRIGQTASATAVFRNAAGATITTLLVTWRSTNPAVASVSGSGSIAAVGVGSTNIIATAAGLSGQASLTVTLVPVAKVAVTLASPSLAVGQTTQATAAVRDSANNALTDRVVAWSSSDTSVALIVSSGPQTAVVRGVAAGNASITATAEGLSGTAAVSVVRTATQLSITTQPSATASSSAAFAVQPIVQLRDASGNTVAESGVGVTAAIASGAGTLGGTTTATTNASGAAVFSNLSISGSGTYTLRFTSSGLATATSSSINIAPVVNPTVGLVAAYGFSETSGATSVDESGHNNTATLGSGVTRTAAGRFGGALVFNGSGMVTIANSASLALGSAMTLEAWVNPSAVNSQWRDVIYKGNDNYFLMATSTTMSAPAGGGTFNGDQATTSAFGTAGLPVNVWTHLGVTYDGAALRLYVNGSLVAAVPRTSAILSSTNPLQLGGDTFYGQYFQGMIDEVRVYNRALSASELQADMNAPVDGGAGSPTDTVAPTVRITAPTTAPSYAIATNTVTIGGTASDNVGVIVVTWTNSMGGSGTATGTANWTASGIPLQNGPNVLTVTARDASGNAGTATLTVNASITPSTSDEPVFNGTLNTVVFQDNMDEYTDVVSMGAMPLGTAPRISPNPSPVTTSEAVDTQIHQLVTGHGGTGKALRLSFPGVDQSAATYLTLNAPSTSDLTTHYFQYWGRVTVAGSLTGATVAVKWFEAWHTSRVDRVQWNTHDHLPCSVSGHDTYWQVYDQGRSTTCQGNQPVGPYFSDVADGKWHRFTYMYRPNSSAGARDGIARMWIDGVKIIDISKAAIGVTPPGGDKPWCLADDVDALAVNDGIYTVWWGSTQTTDSPPWTLDIDDFIWWR